jgi:hypothetical protein
VIHPALAGPKPSPSAAHGCKCKIKDFKMIQVHHIFAMVYFPARLQFRDGSNTNPSD